MEREVGEGIGMGNTCKPMAVSFQCMTKSTTKKKKTAHTNTERKKKKCVLGSPGWSTMPSHMGSENRHLDLAKGKSVNDLDKNGVMVAKKSPGEVNSRKNS